jgi:alkylation response protein AidB-like acyl-CoA dehydrogenase
MFVDLTPEQHALRLEVRDYFQALMTPEMRVAMRGAESGEPTAPGAPMGRDGWLAVGWPKAVRRPRLQGTEQLIFFEEANIAGAPLPFVTISTVGRR